MSRYIEKIFCIITRASTIFSYVFLYTLMYIQCINVFNVYNVSQNGSFRILNPSLGQASNSLSSGFGLRSESSRADHTALQCGEEYEDNSKYLLELLLWWGLSQLWTHVCSDRITSTVNRKSSLKENVCRWYQRH